MLAYIIRRLLLIIPTLFGIMVVNFIVIQAAPGGPVEQQIAKIKGTAVAATARFGGGRQGELAGEGPARHLGGDGAIASKYRGARGLDPEFIREIEKQFGFDKPLPERFVKMLGQFLRFDFGESFFRDRKVVDLVLDKMPVSISLGLWTTLLIYLISIPLGIVKAVRDGSRFDVWTSGVIIVGYAVPGFLFAILLMSEPPSMAELPPSKMVRVAPPPQLAPISRKIVVEPAKGPSPCPTIRTEWTAPPTVPPSTRIKTAWNRAPFCRVSQPRSKLSPGLGARVS